MTNLKFYATFLKVLEVLPSCDVRPKPETVAWKRRYHFIVQYVQIVSFLTNVFFSGLLVGQQAGYTLGKTV